MYKKKCTNANTQGPLKFMTKVGIPKAQVYSSEAHLLCSLCSSWRKRCPPEGGLEQLTGVWNPTCFSALTTGYPSSQIFLSPCLKRGQDKSYILQGAEHVPLTFHLISMPWSVGKGRSCWKGKHKHPIGFMAVKKQGMNRSFSNLPGGLSSSGRPVHTKQQRGSWAQWGELCTGALWLMSWKLSELKANTSLMGNLPPPMLHHFYIIEPTRDCLINKDSRKPSKSRQVKCTACLCINFVHAQVSQVSFPQGGFLPLVGQHLQFLWEEFLWCLGANSVCLRPPVSSSYLWPAALQELLLTQPGSL